VQPGAGGVSPRGFANAIASALPPHYGQRSPNHTHGGPTPTALGRMFASRCTVFVPHSPAFVAQNHGGLTPAALVNVRLCIAKIVFFRHASTVQHNRERGASAPRGFANAIASAFPPHYGQRSPNYTHGGLTPAALDSVFAHRRIFRDSDRTTFGSPRHGGLTPAALVNVRSCIA
jgi:hypothetical protein